MKSIKPNAAGKVESVFMSADMLKPDVEYNFKYTHTTNKTSKAGKEIEWHIFLGNWDNKMTEIMIPDFIMISEQQDFKFKPDKDYKLSKYTEKDILVGSD